jgi:cytochrome c
MPKKLISKSSLIATVVTSVLILVSSNAIAADGAALYTSKGCGGCHGQDGNSPIMGAYPKIAGQNLDYTIQQLADIKSGARSNGQSMSMKGIMAAVSDDEIKALATYLSGL